MWGWGSVGACGNGEEWGACGDGGVDVCGDGACGDGTWGGVGLNVEIDEQCLWNVCAHG